MKPPMLHTAYKVDMSRNAYGDFIASGDTALRCHFREISTQIIDNNEVIESDAMAWFEPDSGIEKNDIIKFDSVFWQVERLTKARRLRQPAVQFIKVELRRYGDIS